MAGLYKLKNTVQFYSWGSPDALPELLGLPNSSGKPWAELWMGAHPKAPSSIWDGHQWQSLSDFIENDPETLLGKTVASRFQSQLPYLFKVLAIAKPLSVQAHPDKEAAEEGFERENLAGIPLDAPHRNYRDTNHKPECICALTPFMAMNGFRQITNIVRLMEPVCPDVLKKNLDQLASEPDSRQLKHFFKALMTLDREIATQAIDQAVDKASGLSHENAAYDWMIRLHRQYKDDVGIFSPLLLNLIQLKPGQAMFLKAGTLHAYLSGLGIEVMANSDNVLRGGLTPKHVDVPELLRILDFVESNIQILEPVRLNPVESVYPTPAREFALSVIEVRPNSPDIRFFPNGVEILICTQGQVTIKANNGHEILDITRGTSVIVFASVTDYQISGNGQLYKSAVPVSDTTD